jgi:hypothetical protein
MRRYKVFKRFKNDSYKNRNMRSRNEMSFNKWSMYHGNDVEKIFSIMYDQFKSINKNFLDMDSYEIMLMEFMKHVYKFSDKDSY